MTTIYEYPFQIVSQQSIELPQHSKILHVGLDPNGTPCLWVQLNTEDQTERRELFVVGTGHPMSSVPVTFVGTFLLGPFVWHIFIE